MIKVTFEMDEERRMVKMTMKGHAQYSDVGNDIICASASMLAYTLAQNVSDMQKCGNLQYEPTIKLNKGNAIVSCRCCDGFYDMLVHTFMVIQRGFELLENNYPKNVALTKFGKA